MTIDDEYSHESLNLEPSGIIKISRTGRQYSIASSEFLVTYPDGSTELIWSTPWHEWTEEQESIEAYKEASKHWKNNARNQ